MKKLFYGMGFLLVAALCWYLLIKPYDYVVSFTARTIPGTLNQSVKSWGAGLDSAKVVGQDGLRKLTQELRFNDSLHLYQWQFDPLTDSTSRIKVYAKDVNHSFKNKLRIPFYDTDFEKRTRKTLLNFNEILQEHLDSFKVTIEGEERLEQSYCACVKVKGGQFEKARGMMKNFPFLGSYLVENNIALNGPPFLEVTYWNMETDSIEYDFCYPILKTNHLPEHPELSYRNFGPLKALKAVYNGNYITSDRAWYALLEYAENEGVSVSGLPVEVFHSNPNMGGDALRWKAEVFMPLSGADE